jgi:hypothetical protein
MHPNITAILKYFDDGAQPIWIALSYRELANKLASSLDGPESTVSLRKLLESRDAAIRASNDPNSVITQSELTRPE